MDKKTLHGMWNYFLMLESDLDNTSRYIEPLNQENVYSFEFAKILILACTEVEAVFKAICHEIDDSQTAGDIGKYKSIILGRYPKIVNTKVSAKRLGRDIYPFAGWDRGPLLWWNGYNDVKHNRESNFTKATYLNAVSALSALYILVFYLSKITGIEFKDYASQYFDSEYANGFFLHNSGKPLPDYET